MFSHQNEQNDLEVYAPQKAQDQAFLEAIMSKPHNNLTQLLSIAMEDIFALDYPDFIAIMQDAIPESAYLKAKANVSAEGIKDDKIQKNIFGLTEDEEIRAFSGLLRFKDIINGTEADYNNFVACQIEMKKPVLSFTSFKKIREYVLETLTTPEDYAAAVWSILCNDLGKVHMLIDVYDNLPEHKGVSHDLLLAELLKLKPELFPGFMELTSVYREQIIAGYASGCDISQLEQLELPPVAIEALRKLDAKALDLYILHTIFDVSGAAAHFKSNGSLTLHEETWAFFNATREALQLLKDPNSSISDVYNHYLQFRGHCVGIDELSPETVALIRIAGLSRLATKEQGEMLGAVWANLPESVRSTLITELNVHGGEDLRAIFVGYGVAMLLNPQSALQKELNEASKNLNLVVGSEQKRAASIEGLRIGLINLANAFATARALIKTDAKREIFVAECDEVARFLSREPRKSLQMVLALTAQNDRRADYKLVTPTLTKEETIETVQSKQADMSNLSSQNLFTQWLKPTVQEAKPTYQDNVKAKI